MTFKNVLHIIKYSRQRLGKGEEVGRMNDMEKEIIKNIYALLLSCGLITTEEYLLITMSDKNEYGKA